MATPSFPALSSENQPLIVGIIGQKEHLAFVSENTAPCALWEWRIDSLLASGVSVEELLALPSQKPILITVRSPKEGGVGHLSLARRQELIRTFLPKASAVDLEIIHLEDFAEEIALIQQKGLTLLTSFHDFEQSPSLDTLKSQQEKALSVHPQIIKFAYKVFSLQDIEDKDILLRETNSLLALMGMGELGAISRAHYTQKGSCLLYGYLGQSPNAPGQLSVEECLKIKAAL